MKRILWLTIFLTLFSIPSLAQKNNPCPSIKAHSSAEIYPEGQVITFVVDVLGETSIAEIKYKWTVSAGTIEQGQGTPVIIVSKVKAQKIIADVEVLGLPQDCSNKSSASVVVKKFPPIRDVFPIQYQNTKELKAQLDRLVTVLKSNYESKVHFIFYNGTKGNKISFDSFKSKVLKILVNSQKISRKRISIINSNSDYYDSNSFMIWIVDKNGNAIF
jgi:hypothetical protein